MVLACKQQKRNAQSEGGLVATKDRLVVEISLIMEMDDVVEIFYRDSDETFTSENSMAYNAKGSIEYQKGVFVLDQFIFPSHVRIDLGSNPQQAPIIIDYIAFKYNDAEHIYSIDELKKYFKANQYLDFDFDRLTGEGQMINGKYDPYLSSYDISYFVNKLILY